MRLSAVGLLLVAACASKREAHAAPFEPPVSAEAEAWLRKLERVDIEKLTHVWPKSRALPDKAYEIVPLREPLAADGVGYRMVVDHEANLFWIEVSGTINGTLEYRGPAALKR